MSYSLDFTHLCIFLRKMLLDVSDEYTIETPLEPLYYGVIAFK